MVFKLISGVVAVALALVDGSQGAASEMSSEHGKMSLEYVFEVVRHGARAPLIASEKFPVQSEMLTPMGMRQRYLLGRYNQEMYGKWNNSDLLRAIDIQSTDVLRTIQSGYSELHGVNAGSDSPPLKLTPKQVEGLKAKKRGLPQFKCRNSDKINEDLGQLAIVDGFVEKAIHTYIETEWVDNVNTYTCNFAAKVDGGRYQNDSTYADVMYLKDSLKNDYAETFGLDQEQVDNMTFFDAYLYSDAVFSQRFEGIPQVVNWTDEQISMVNNTQLYGLVLPFTSKARKLMISKLLEKGISDIQEHTLGRRDDENCSHHHAKAPRYRLYSAHDTQIANILFQIDPKYSFLYVPYASNIYFELYKSEGHNLEHNHHHHHHHEHEFFVRTMYNG